MRWRKRHRVVGTVEVWHDEEGWGVLRTPDGPSVFCHFGHIAGEAGQRVKVSTTWLTKTAVTPA